MSIGDLFNSARKKEPPNMAPKELCGECKRVSYKLGLCYDCYSNLFELGEKKDEEIN